MSKEHAYAYEAGYRDGSIHYELEHCPACKNVADLQEALAENAKLREQMERLVTLLRVDCDIDASWDGLRRFWSIGLTEDGCLMRDRACKAEAENAKLRELAARMAEALGIDCEWADPNWCKSPCVLEFGCWPIEEHTEIQCPAWAAMHELGVEVGVEEEDE